MNGTPIDAQESYQDEVLMFDLVNGKTILCRVREPSADEEYFMDPEEPQDDGFLVVNPRILNVVPVGNGRANIMLIPYLNGKEVTIFANHVVGSSTAPRVYYDQYLQDTTGLVTTSQMPQQSKLDS